MNKLHISISFKPNSKLEQFIINKHSNYVKYQGQEINYVINFTSFTELTEFCKELEKLDISDNLIKILTVISDISLPALGKAQTIVGTTLNIYRLFGLTYKEIEDITNSCIDLLYS